MVHGPHQGDSLGMVAPGHAVDIGDQRMAQLHGGTGYPEGLGIIAPGAALQEGVVGAVQAQDRAEHAELHPTGIKLGVLNAVDVPADVMAPPAVAHIGGSGGEVRLESQRIPGNDRVAGKADRVAVVAQAAPAREEEGALGAIPAQVVKMQVIDPPQRVEPRQWRWIALLPVHPPEIDAIGFLGVVQDAQSRPGQRPDR